jgi:hypothetical protein
MFSGIESDASQARRYFDTVHTGRDIIAGVVLLVSVGRPLVVPAFRRRVCVGLDHHWSCSRA